jgi:YwiC-like protein
MDKGLICHLADALIATGARPVKPVHVYSARVSLLPREHGAYGQMALPLVTSLAVAGITLPALLIALSVVAGFLSHEPLLVLLGQRGARATREMGRRAMIWVTILVAIAIGSGLFALALVPIAIRWSFLLPVVPAVVLTPLIAKKQEKSGWAEVAVALAFSCAAVPVCMAAGSPLRTALAVATVFAAIFVTATLAVRVVVLRVRGGGNPQAERKTRMAALILTGVIASILISAAMSGWTPWATVLAAAPGLALAAGLALFPPSPTRLRVVGWTLVVASAAAAITLVTAL